MARNVTLRGTAQKAAIYGSAHAESYIRSELENHGIGVASVTVKPQSWTNNWVTVNVTVRSPEWQSRSEIESVVTQAFRNIASTAGGVPIISSPSRFTVTSDNGAHANLAHIVGEPVNWDALNPSGGRVTAGVGGTAAHTNLSHIVGKPVNWDALNPSGGGRPAGYVHQGGNLATVTVSGGWGNSQATRNDDEEPAGDWLEENMTTVMMVGFGLIVILATR
jgi:sarcosine oxidase gamma subunit